jgi:hypothetical protein
MPLIKFSNKAAEGFYLLATNGEVGGYPGDIFAVSERLLKELETEFQAKGITYQKLDPKTLNSNRQRCGEKR